jgi:uncharacterized membrane protein YvlD (DUF360 family)
MLTHFLIGWIASTLGLWASAQLLSGVRVASLGDAAWAGALLYVLEWLLSGPLFVALGIGTLGVGFLLWFVTRWIVAALVVGLTSRLSDRLDVDGFWNALLTAFIVSLSGSFVRYLL